MERRVSRGGCVDEGYVWTRERKLAAGGEDRFEIWY